MASLDCFVREVQSHKEIMDAAYVLSKLEKRGLIEPAIASGWIRGWLAGTPKSDIDVSYVGNIPYQKAQQHLRTALDESGIHAAQWDIAGIWNIQQQYPSITKTELNFKYFYVCSIDSVYLASDGKLHDTMQTGIEDARNGILRMNDFETFDFPYPDDEIVYFCLEGCRRIARFHWQPTARSVELIRGGRKKWDTLSDERKEYLLRKRILGKYSRAEFGTAKDIYAQYGWGNVFDQASVLFDAL